MLARSLVDELHLTSFWGRFWRKVDTSQWQLLPHTRLQNSCLLVFVVPFMALSLKPSRAWYSFPILIGHLHKEPGPAMHSAASGACRSRWRVAMCLYHGFIVGHGVERVKPQVFRSWINVSWADH